MRVTFLIDGFNLYHAAKDCALSTNGFGTRWLNLRALCERYLPEIGRNAVLHEVIYFSALATHLQKQEPSVVDRHRTYINALRSTGVRIELGKFKRSTRTCKNCGARNARHEEKETDVAIGAHLVAMAADPSREAVYVLSGDSDLTAAIRVAQRIDTSLRIGALFPPGRTSDEIRELVHRSMKIKSKRIRQSQFPDVVRSEEGSDVRKPDAW